MRNCLPCDRHEADIVRGLRVNMALKTRTLRAQIIREQEQLIELTKRGQRLAAE